MENKDIILFILVISVIYLLYCNGNKESFTSTSIGTATTSGTQDVVDALNTHIVSEVNRRFTEQIIKDNRQY